MVLITAANKGLTLNDIGYILYRDDDDQKTVI